MFIRNYRYISSGVLSNIEEHTQLAMWQLIDGLKIRKDCIQVFELTSVYVDGITLQKIFHFQEQPAYQEEVLLPAFNPVDLVVYVIDEGGHSSMILSGER